MKIFLTRLLLFSIPLILFVLYTEIKLSGIPTTYEYKRKNLESQLPYVEVLILGNSQAFGGINPEYLSAFSFNLCNNSQTLYYDAELTRKYLNDMPKLKYVLINISYFSFWHIMEDSHEPWRKKFYYKYWDIKPEGSNVLLINKHCNISLYTPRTALNLIFKAKGNSDFFTTYKSNGWAVNDTARVHKINLVEARNRISFFEKQYIHEIRIETNRVTMKNLLASLTEERITPVFVSTPLPEIFASLINPEIQRLNNKIIDVLCKDYGCKYYDYTSDQRFTSADFIDVNHLNFIGAEKFSKIVNYEILLQQRINDD